MDRQPTLSNDLVLLRPLVADDFDALFEVARDPVIWEQHPAPDRYRKPVFTKFFQESLDSGGALVIIDQSSHQIIGSSRYEVVDKLPAAIEIGWTFLARDYWGGHYNMAVKKLMIDYAFLSIDDVFFYIGKNNIRSQRAAEKIGAVRLHHSIAQPFQKDAVNNYTYRIRKRNWKQSLSRMRV